ncbi:unnamed protein product [Urochloa humidicola]
MATEDEAREAADGTEVQVEAVDLGTVHFEAHPEVKLPSITEIKNVGQNIDSAEGMLKIPEDQVLVEAPSEVELPPEHNLNGKASSFNCHMDKEEKISNEQPHDNDQEEAELDGTIAHQSNGISNEEVTDSLSHGESTTEDNNLLKHEKDEEPSSDDQQPDVILDVNSVQEDTLKTDSAIEQTDDGQQDQNQEPEKGNEDTQPASTANNANVEVLAEAPTVLQTPVEPNLDDSGTVPGTINEKMETEEPDKTDGVVHPDHKESFPEDASIAESAEEVVRVEDQQSQQADTMDEDVVQEDVPKSENADEPATNAHDVLNQESTEETDGPVNEKTEESAHQSNMAAPEETTPENDTMMVELPVNIQLLNQESVEEIEDAEAVDTEAARQQSTVAFEEAIPEEQHNFGITMDSDTVQENTLEAIEQTEDVPQNHDLGQEKATENTPSATIPDVEVVAEAPSEVQTPVTTNLDNSDAIPDTADANTETDESAKAEDATATSEPHVTETEEEQKGIETTEAQEMTEHGHVIPSKELSAEDDSTADEPHNDDIQKTLGQDLVEAKETVFTSEDNVEDNVTVEEQTCDSQEVDNAESTEETMGNTAENIAEVSDVMIVDSIKEQNVLETGDVAETHKQELEPEETKNTEPVESEEASDQRNVVLFDDLAQEGTPAESEMQQTESATESTETEAQENNVYESEPTADIQPVQEPEPEPEEIKNTELAEVNETSHEMNTTVFQTPVGEDNPAMIYLHESAREMSNIEATEVGTPQQSDAAQLEEQAPELIASEPQVPEPESVEEMNGTEATETPNISQGNLISTSGEFAPEEITTEDKKSTEPDGDHQQEEESPNFMETEADKPQEIALSSTLSTSEQLTSEDNETATEPSSDTQAENADPAEETEGAETVKSNSALAEAAASEEHDATVDTSSVQEPELEETNDAEPAGTEDIVASSDLPAENMGMETMGTEAVPRESHVQSIKELTEDDTTAEETHNDDIQQTLGKYPNEVQETVFTSEENTVIDNVTAEEPTCDSKEVNNAESTEETKGNTAENIAEVSDVLIVDEAVEEQNVLETGDIAETHMRELEPEETKNTEPVESEEASDQRNAVQFSDLAQKDTLESEMQQMESATETTETEAAPHESNGCVTEEPSPKDHKIESETDCDIQKANVTESFEVIDCDEHIKTGGITGHSNMVCAEESAQEKDVPKSESTADTQPVQEREPEESNNTKLVDVKETSQEINTNPNIIDLHESARELSSIEDTEVGTTHQSEAPQLEQAPEGIGSEPQVPEPESVEVTNDTKAIEPPNISQRSLISTSVPEEIATEDKTITELDVDHQQLQDQESTDFKQTEADKPQGIDSSSTLSTSEQSTSEDNKTAKEPSSGTQAENSEPAEVTEGAENVKSNTALAEATAPEEHVETDATADTSSVKEPELEETKDAEPAGTEDIMASRDLPAENMDLETMGTEAVPRESHVESIKEPTEDDTEPVLELESVEDTKCTDTMEHPEEPHDLMSVPGIKDEIQTSVELKDGACDLGETVLPTEGSENVTDEAAVQSPGNDVVEASNNIDQVKEEQKDGCEHNSSEISGVQNVGNIIHIQDRDISGEPLTKRGPEEASQALFESDPQGAQDAAKEDDSTEGGEKTSDLSKQPDDVALQLQTCEADALSIGRQDDVVQNVDLDQQQKEDEETESQKEELQADEQKHEDKGDDFAMEPLVEPEDIENSTKNRTEDTAEAEQTEMAITEILEHEEAPHVSEESTPSSMDMKADNVKGTHEVTEEDADAKNDNKYETAEKNDIVATDSTNKQDETTDETTNEEDPAAVTQNVESGEHSEDKECTDKVNDHVHTIQASEEEITGEINENREIRSEDNAEQDLSSHQKVEDEKLSMTEQNDVDIEAASDIQEKADESASDINLTSQCQEEINTDDVQQLEIEETSPDKIDETVSHEKTETSTTEVVTINDSITNKASEADGGSSDGSLKTCNDTGRDLDVSSVITASREESVNDNMEDHKLDLPAQDENTPEQALYLEKTEREMPSSQKILPTEPEENQIPNESNEEELQAENPMPNEKNEEDMKDREIGDAEKDVEQDLPVSHFLMNLILGKKNGGADENSEPEAERKQGETTEDNSCMLISKQEESKGSLSTENKADDDITFEQEKHDVECPEETQEMVKEQSDDLMLDKERSMHTDEESNKNTHDSEILAYQGNPEDKISGEVSSEEAAGVSTKMETRDIEISNLELNDKEVDTVCQEKTEASTKIENGSLNSNINDLANTEASEEDTLGEGEAGLLHESLPEDKTADALSEKMPLLTESDMVDEKDLSCDVEAVKVLACAKEDATTKPSISATTTTDIQLECEEVDKKEEEQHASTATSEVSREDAEILNDNVQKSSTSSEVTSDEQASQITEPISDTQKILAHEKEISEGSTCMDVKEISNFSIKGVENFQTEVEIQADGPNMQVNQDKKDEVADKKTTMEPEKLGKSDFQEHQETATEQKSPKATDEGDQQLLIKNETMIKEQVVPRTVESHEQTVSIKSNEEQELFDSKVQERDLNMVSPRELSASEENFVEVTKPGFSTDEEQSPKADAEEKTYDEKIKDFTDGAATKTEVPGATQKARKKQNLLSGVGSKVKQQLAKVKKAIVRKPGNTKPDSPKS